MRVVEAEREGLGSPDKAASPWSNEFGNVSMTCFQPEIDNSSGRCGRALRFKARPKVSLPRDPGRSLGTKPIARISVHEIAEPAQQVELDAVASGRPIHHRLSLIHI